ncbi:ubiquitin family protein [Blastomyces dermatitidis ATCC 18188]|uniref:Ubiquitin family protein n=1 Tax=Ajellomyces dermatitidis (strain ATCC 18188 / CBS 674.68) TaxID=653446 RepID=F2TB92_AJEDA|nr:ubiquitin family protein [Blastomyces dermatitidis ATCC 18188]
MFIRAEQDIAAESAAPGSGSGHLSQSSRCQQPHRIVIVALKQDQSARADGVINAIIYRAWFHAVFRSLNDPACCVLAVCACVDWIAQRILPSSPTSTSLHISPPSVFQPSNSDRIVGISPSASGRSSVTPNYEESEEIGNLEARMSTDTKPRNIDGVDGLSSASSSDVQTIVLHIVSPSLQNRVTLNNVPLAIKILELKTRLSEALPNHPRPDVQRLIYRGKPLLNNEDQLGNIVAPADGRVHTMHLVLPPSQVRVTIPPPPNLAPDLPNPGLPNPQQELSGLRLRTSGTSHTDPTAPRPQVQAQFNSATAANQVATLRQQVIAQHQHLAAQIAQNARLPSTNRPAEAGLSTAINPAGIPIQNNIDSPLYVDVNSPLYGTRFGLSTPNLQSERMSSIPSNQDRNPSDSQSTSSRATLFDSSAPQPFPIQRTASFPPSRPTWLGETGMGVGTLGENRRRIPAILEQILGMESQVRRGQLPTIESICRIRIQLYQILDEQDRNPLAPRDIMPENLLARLSSLTARVDQIRLLRTRSFTSSPQNSLFNPPPTLQDPTQTSIYLVSSPSGYHAVLLPPTGAPGRGTIQPGTQAFHAHRPIIHPPITSIPHEAPHAAPNPMIIPPAVNQAILQQQERHRIFLGPANFSRILGRLWLFVRLYFFCYIFSEDGTWFRIILVSLSVLTALLSETDLLQRAQRAVIDPLHRHLENLLPVDTHQPRDAGRARRGVDTNVPPVHPMQPNNINEGLRPAVGTQHNGAMANSQPAGAYNRLRTAERAFALLLASLVPGVGERRVAARNAAEAARQNELAAEREAEENQAREQGNEEAEARGDPSGEESEDAAVPELDPQPAHPTDDLEEDRAIET